MTSMPNRLLAALFAFGLSACGGDAADQAPADAPIEAPGDTDGVTDEAGPDGEPGEGEPGEGEPGDDLPPPRDPSLDLPDEPGVHQGADGRDCLTTGHGGAVFCGDWRYDADAGRWVATGDVAIQLGAGEHILSNADLWATLNPPRVGGTAETHMPSPWEEDWDSETVPVEINHPANWEDEESETSGVEIDGAMGGAAGGVLGFVSDAVSVLDPVSGVLTSAGEVALDVLDATTIQDAEIYIQLGDPRPFTARGPFFDGEDFYQAPAINAHMGVTGSLHLLPFPVIFDGNLHLDLDPDGYGDMFWEDGAIAIAGDGALRLGYEHFGFDLSWEIADAGMHWDVTRGDIGALSLRAATDQHTPFEGTPLDILDFGQSTTFYGHFVGADDFAMRYEFDGKLMAIEIRDAMLQLSDGGVELTFSTRSLPLLSEVGVDFAGSIGSDGQFSVTGEANINVFGRDVNNATLTVNNDGASATFELDIPGMGSLELSGELSDNPRFEGRGDLTIAGFEVVGAHVVLSSAGIAINGTLQTPFFQVEVSGSVNGDGVEMRGRVDIRPAGFRMANAEVIVGTDGVTINGRVALPNVAEVEVTGTVRPDATFSLRGESDIRIPVLDVQLTRATVTIGSDGATIEGRMGFAGIDVNLSGFARPNGEFRLTGSVVVEHSIDLAGHGVSFRGAANFTVGHDVLRAGFELNVEVRAPDIDPLDILPESARARIAGTIDNDGGICADLPLIGEHCIDLF